MERDITDTFKIYRSCGGADDPYAEPNAQPNAHVDGCVLEWLLETIVWAKDQVKLRNLIHNDETVDNVLLGEAFERWVYIQVEDILDDEDDKEEDEDEEDEVNPYQKELEFRISLLPQELEVKCKMCIARSQIKCIQKKAASKHRIEHAAVIASVYGDKAKRSSLLKQNRVTAGMNDDSKAE